MPVEIHVGNVKVNTVDRSFVNIGPSIKTGLRAKSRMNQGMGEVMGNTNQVFYQSKVDDRDQVDFVQQKKAWSSR
ncbi:hypothetical protein [Tumebacillus lipolyticus]|uniref:Spore germination protein GerPA/GerPF n=1 Tax=Tumebacillus lipolyticus TaxID=1280370 RepID=A0ABW4ZZD5_9BACL